MLGTAVAQLSVATSVALGLPMPGWALDHLVSAALGTQREFGGWPSEGLDAVSGPTLDESTRRVIQARRFRAQAQRAARETVHYAGLFATIGVQPERMTDADIVQVPCTSKAAYQAAPRDFVSARKPPWLTAYSTGTTAPSVGVAFSERELQVFAALSALGFLMSNEIHVDDVVYLAGPCGRLSIAAYMLQRACDRIGARCLGAANLPIEGTLRRLAGRPTESGTKDRPTVLQAAPSLVGALVERGLALGYRSRDFNVKRILTGGEILTAGLQNRVQDLFGQIQVSESYAMTETFGAGGQVCSAGHLHFHPAHGLIEVVDPETHAPVERDGIGTLIVTPLPPFRETTLLLRYDSEDLVREVPEPRTCSLRTLPAVSRVLGKRKFSLRHKHGWTFPRDLLEALEGLDQVPLPGRCGMWLSHSGVAVEVLVRAVTPVVRAQVSDRLAAAGVPVTQLHLVTDPLQLRCPMPARYAE